LSTARLKTAERPTYSCISAKKKKTAARVEYWMSYPLMVDCPTCGKTYDYSNGEEKVRPKELPSPARILGWARPASGSEHISFTGKLRCSRLLLPDHHMHGGYSGDVFIHLISKGGELRASK
jgi:hypothetical protein